MLLAMLFQIIVNIEISDGEGEKSNPRVRSSYTPPPVLFPALLP